MRFSLDKPVKIIMLGAGGTGGHAAPHLYRLLHTLECQTGSVRPVKVIIADGDIVEEKNLVRQNFISADLGRNKAQVLAQRYATAFGMEVQYIPEFIEDENRLAELIKPDMYSPGEYSYQRLEGHSILIGAVDNNKSRQLCHQAFQKTDNPRKSILLNNTRNVRQIQQTIEHNLRNSPFSACAFFEKLDHINSGFTEHIQILLNCPILNTAPILFKMDIKQPVH